MCHPHIHLFSWPLLPPNLVLNVKKTVIVLYSHQQILFSAWLFSGWSLHVCFFCLFCLALWCDVIRSDFVDGVKSYGRAQYRETRVGIVLRPYFLAMKCQDSRQTSTISDLKTCPEMAWLVILHDIMGQQWLSSICVFLRKHLKWPSPALPVAPCVCVYVHSVCYLLSSIKLFIYYIL